MPGRPTTYPTLGESIRIKARGLDDGFYPGLVGDLFTLADVADNLATELARTRAELTDMTKLAKSRLEVSDRRLDEALEALRERDLARAEALRHERNWLSAGARADRLGARVADMTHQLSVAAQYAAAQPCSCSEHEVRANVADPCDRCLILGRRLDEPVDQ